ncbi:hypothetical protein [uncultured Corynebacterium sp.]|uniref:hypothetical protein n=1 Tax=uncultured Corynebacterium sp. TaxID=159447 RepID=UPI00261DAC7C|nr:hypothetical protein [uncultured Corynebacterium sp.]
MRDEDISEQDLRILRAEAASMVRGRRQSEWWEEVERLTAGEKFAEAEELLVEMRDAAAESTRIAGWTVPFAPTQGLLSIYLKQGRIGDADQVLADYLDCLQEYRIFVPEGGDTGERRAREWVEALSDPKARAHWKEQGGECNGGK